MKILQFKNFEELSAYTADFISKALKNNPRLVLCMASGSTPGLACDLLVKKLVMDKIDYSELTFIGLDEWVGLRATNTGSCRYFFQTRIVDPLRLNASQYFFFDGEAKNLRNECIKMDRLIYEKGGIDLMLVGIGLNGHIGFNEPGTPSSILSHVAKLEEITRAIGQEKYFSEPVDLAEGITIGLGHLINTNEVLLMANGNKKAGVIKKTIEGTVTENFPASIMQKHTNGYILIDGEAGSLLENK